jgi:Asp-tRNA(Asn)/Glu-tRNA(Gln) amidotransferase A subunit family amidase
MSLHTNATTAVDLAAKIRNGAVSPVDAVETSLDRIKRQDDELNAFITVLEEEARAAAKEAEAAVDSGDELGPLHGVPVAVKDIMGMKAGVRHSFGLKELEDFVPDESSTFVKRIEAAGGIIVGKTSCPELGHLGHTHNRIVGTTANPFDHSRSPGGSSGGSAAALAAGLVPLAQGSDGGGSLRMPASMCGVVSIKPTPGVVPFDFRPNGFVHCQPFLYAGPMARTVEDAALFLDVMSGYSPSDPISLPNTGEEYLAATDNSIDGSKIGYTLDFDVWPVDQRVRDIVEDAVQAFEETGAEVKKINVDIDRSLDELRDSWKAGWETFAAETAELWKAEPFGLDFLANYSEDINWTLINQIEQGYDYSGVDLRMANIIRTEVFDTVQELFREYDFLVMPTIAIPPFDGSLHQGPSEIDGQEIDPWQDWTLTWLFNQAPHPVMNVPAGFTDDGLPIGMQIVGPPHGDHDVIAAGAVFERERPWHDQYDALTELS